MIFELFVGNLITAVLVLIIAVYIYLKWSFGHWKRRNIPYFEPNYPFGNLENPLESSVWISELFDKFYKKAKSKGLQLCGIYLFTQPKCLIVNKELITNILKDSDHFIDRGLYRNRKIDILRDILISKLGVKWRNRANKFTSEFSHIKKEVTFQGLLDSGAAFEKYITECIISSQPVNVKKVFEYYSNEVISSCVFGLTCFKQPNVLMKLYGKKLSQEPISLVLKYEFVSSYPNVARALGIRIFSKEVNEYFKNMILRQISSRKSEVKKNFLEQFVMDKKDNSYKNNKRPTMDEVITSSFMFFKASQETCLTIMTSALFYLAVYPKIQENVREEISSMLKRYNDRITYDSIRELTYMKYFFYETSRLCNATGYVSRKCVRDYKVPGENITIEKGTNIVIPAFSIHRDNDIWENPEVFNPDRFSNISKIQEESYFGFDQHSKDCLGKRFGELQAKVGVACLLRKFRVKLHEKTACPANFLKDEMLPKPDKIIWLYIENL